MRQFGLIGKTLKHSFSKKYFSEKFQNENVQECQYDLFELESISEFPELILKYRETLVGLNVTIPYKKEVIPFLDELDENAAAIQAVNTIKRLPNGQLKGYNTDYIGFLNSLKAGWELSQIKALVLGTGGASQAVKKALKDLNIPYQSVSRQSSDMSISYEDISKGNWVSEYQLIINTTPLGTHPNVDEKPALPYDQLSPGHLLFDLVYNPETTAFMQEGLNRGAQVKNGYAMLVGQAEEAWKIWNS